MSVYQLEPSANTTLDDIYSYTLDHWGDAQADLYLTGLFATFETIAAGTAHTRNAKQIFGIEAWFCRYEHHYIYWKYLEDRQIGILAIIHESRQQAARFADAQRDNNDHR